MRNCCKFCIHPSIAHVVAANVFHCSLCAKSYSSKHEFELHKRRKEHKDKKNPVVAAVAAAAKKIAKAAKQDLSEAKKAERDNQRDRRRQAKTQKFADQRRRSYERYQRIKAQDSSEPIVPDGTVDDVFDALVRYYASTNVAMLLDDDPEAIAKNIKRFCYVDLNTKKELRKLWEEGLMADGQPLYACASCGIRDFDTNYIEEEIQKLPEYFIFNKKDKIKFAKLQAGVRLMSEHGKLDDHRTDLSPIMFSYLSYNGKRYHLQMAILLQKMEQKLKM